MKFRRIVTIATSGLVLSLWCGSVSSAGETNQNERERDIRSKKSQAEAVDERSRMSEVLFAQADVAQAERQLEQAMKLNEEERQRRRKHLEQFRMLKMLELLDLNEDQELTFISSLRRMRRDLQAIHRERRELLERLASGLREKRLESEAVYQITASLEDERQKREMVRATFFKETRTLLSAPQFGRLVVFEEQFDARLLEQIGGRHRQPGRPGKSRRMTDG